MIWYSYLKSL